MALAASAQTDYTIMRACHPDDVKNYDTNQLRSHFTMPSVMENDKSTSPTPCTTALSSAA